MRTTVDLDPDLHRVAVQWSRDRRTSLSHLVNDALRQILFPVGPVERDVTTGLGVVKLGRPLTVEEVADALDDE